MFGIIFCYLEKFSFSVFGFIKKESVAQPIKIEWKSHFCNRKNNVDILFEWRETNILNIQKKLLLTLKFDDKLKWLFSLFGDEAHCDCLQLFLICCGEQTMKPDKIYVVFIKLDITSNISF